MAEILPVDYAMAIWLINPAAEYRLNKSVPPDQDILEWKGPGKQPTVEELRVAWEAYLAEVAADEAAEAAKEQAKEDALERLRTSVDPAVVDLVTVVDRLEERMPVEVKEVSEIEVL